MSNNANALQASIPVLDGPNYQIWAQKMTMFLMSQGLWQKISKVKPSAIVAGKEKKEQDLTDTDVIENEDAREEWEENNAKALGMMLLRVHHTIVNKFETELYAATVWASLKNLYGKPGLAGVYLEFKGAMETYIPGNQDPSIALDKLETHFARLYAAQCQIPEHFQVMIVLSKLPPSYAMVAQQACQNPVITGLKMADIRRLIVLSWEQRGFKGPGNHNNQANKMSAVQCHQNQPQFQQQQREDGQDNGRGGRGGGRGGKRPHGRRGGQKQQANQAAQSETGPSSTRASSPAPTFNSQFQFASMATIPPHKSVYPTFGAAFTLAKRIGVTPTIETLKRLERPEEKTQDPRPRKKQRGTTPDDEVVLLGWSENDADLVDAFMVESTDLPDLPENQTGIFGRYENNKDMEVVANTLHTVTKSNCTSKIVLPNISHLSPSEHESHEATWILDSGASVHFTGCLDDFIDYKAIEPIVVTTATSQTKMIGKGTILLQIENKRVRIYPVFYVPDLNSRLLLLGTFPTGGLHMRGSDHKIILYDDKKEFLSFHPCTAGDTIFTVSTIAGLQIQPKTIYSIDYQTVHRRLAHPSDEVLRRAKKHIKDFPEIQIPKEHICPGCAQGKMPQKSFAPSGLRASKPFELIHSDLKSFPIESYRKFKYCIVFYDDYTSHAWTMNLRTKDAALHATKQFLAMVKNQFKTQIQGWMSDAGGEYTSKAFQEMLKNEGIRILQSVPHAHQQNGRAERIIRTLTEKAESIRLQACLPQSWWEFTLDHATHVYNRTPICRLNWQTPIQLLYGECPTVDNLRVFGCAAYVFIPAEVRQNKLAPKSKLMTYLGTHPGGKGWIFMRGPNNVVFAAAQATFDESMFPKCPTTGHRYHTRVQQNAPEPSQCPKNRPCQCPLPNEGGFDDLEADAQNSKPRTIPKPNIQKGKQVAKNPPQKRRDSSPETPRSPTPDPIERWSEVPEPEQPQPPVPIPAGRPQRMRKVPVKPGNVYGDKHPVDIEKGIRRTKDWKKIVEETSSCPVPGPSRRQLPRRETPRSVVEHHSDSEVPPGDLEDEI